MARGRSRSRKKRPKKKRSAKQRPSARAKQRSAPPRRARRIKARTGPVQLWLPLQMPLGLLGGIALAPAANQVVECVAEDEPAQHAVMAEQSSLFE